MPRKPAPRKTPPLLTPHLESSAVIAKDLREQPESKYVLIVGTSAERRPNYYAVDAYRIKGALIEFLNHTAATSTVFVARVDGQWSLVSRSAVKIVTERDLMLFSKEDVTARNAFYKELDALRATLEGKE